MFTDTMDNARFDVICRMADAGFRVDLIQLQNYKFPAIQILQVTYSGCISGKLSLYQDGQWLYRTCFKPSASGFMWNDKPHYPGSNLEGAIDKLLTDMLNRSRKCGLPLLQVTNL